MVPARQGGANKPSRSKEPRDRQACREVKENKNDGEKGCPLGSIKPLVGVLLPRGQAEPTASRWCFAEICAGAGCGVDKADPHWTAGSLCGLPH